MEHLFVQECGLRNREERYQQGKRQTMQQAGAGEYDSKMIGESLVAGSGQHQKAGWIVRS